MKKFLLYLSFFAISCLTVWHLKVKPSEVQVTQTDSTLRSSEPERKKTEAQAPSTNPDLLPLRQDSQATSEPANGAPLEDAGETESERGTPAPPENTTSRPLVAESNYMKSIEEITLEVMESEKTLEMKDELNGDQLKRISLRKTSFKYPYLIVEESLTVNSDGEETLHHAEALVADHVIVNLQPYVDLDMAKEELKDLNCSLGDKITEGVYLVNIKGKPSIGNHFEKRELLDEIEHLVEIVEPDFFITIVKMPNDSQMNRLWGLHNTGQTGGTQDKDLDGPEAWDKTTGSKNVLAAIIDTGIDRNHEDLKANMWTNPGEIAGNGKDDDGNGFIDDVHGWDFVNNDNNPHDDNSHGTHCAGTIGGVGNNGKGVAGVAWNVSMVGIKFLSGSGRGSSSDAIKSIAYATKIGVDFTSNSWGGGGSSTSMKRAIEEAGKKGIGFIAAAGNHNGNNDSRPSYPASYELDNVIAVGANDHNGKKASFSCYGKNSVDLFAPGVNTYSTVPGNKYASYSGTSMATPHVAGVYALVQSIKPDWTCKQIKEALMSSTDPEDSLKERCVTGGRLNAAKALQAEPAKERLIAAKPTKLDFGKVRISEPKTIELVLSNPGTDETTITKASITKEITKAKNLIGHWTFDEGTGVTAANSGTRGNTYKATLLGGAAFSTQEKKFGTGSLHIPANHKNAMARVNSTLKLGGGSYRETFSVSAWFKKLYASNNGWRTLSRGSSYGHHLIVGSGNDSVGVYANSNGDWRDSGEFDMPSKSFQNAWHHIVAVSDKTSNRTKFYLNGQYKGDSDRPTGNNIYSIGNHYGGGQRFAEYLDDFRVYDIALSANEVTSIFNEEKASSPYSFSLDTPVKLAPGKGIKATVTFTGTEQGKSASNLLISSDAKNNTTLSVPLSAEVTTTPDLVVNPESMHFDLNENETKTQAITLSNKGDGDLTYSVSILGESGQPSKKTEVFGMGYNGVGQLGDGTKTNRSKPVQIIPEGIQWIGTGSIHSLFLKNDGSLWATGMNTYGQLGDGSTTNRSKPVQIQTGGVKAAATGLWHSFFIKEDGSLWAMGNNRQGGLGDGTKSNRNKPVKIIDGEVKAVVGGGNHSLFVKNDGSLWAMGYNNYGQLGDGTKTSRSKPVQIVSSGVQSVATGYAHSLFLKNDGSLWAMGWNSYGQLGDGTTTSRSKPVQIVSSGVQSISTRYRHSLFLKNDGSLWAMGYNKYGELGDGTKTNRSKPVQIIPGGVKSMSAGSYHTLIHKKEGSLWAVGCNNYGQLGDGTKTSRSKPIKILDGEVSQVAAGWWHSMFLKGEGNGEAPHWLTSNQSKGSLAPGANVDLKLAANASKMPTEYEEAHILVSSNDPDEPQKKIKVTAQRLSEKAGLVFRPSSLSFENTYVGQTAEKALILSNAGTKELTVNQFAFRDSAFSHRLSLPLTLRPGERKTETIYFTPKAAGKVNSSAFVLTNEDGGKTRTLEVSAEGSLAPVMVITPPALSATLKSKQERNVNLRISNSGGSPLTWTLKGATTGGGKALSVPFFAQSHFMPLEKGAEDNREGMPVSTLGGGPDWHGYNWMDSKDPAGPVHQWKDISKTGKLLSEASKSDDSFDKVTLPFAMELYGKTFKEAFVSSNGYLTLGKGSSEHGHFPLPTTMMPGNLIAPFAMDLDPSRGGDVYVQQTANEVLVQWNRVKDFAGIGEYTFQASLNRNGVVYFHYEKMNGKIDRATTGIQNEAADQGLLVAYNNQQVKADSTTRISTSPKWLHVATTSGTIEGGKYLNVPVTFKAGSILSGNYKATLKISGNDPKIPTFEVPVSLTIQATRTLAFNPSAIDFGQVSVGASGEKTVRVTNTGNAAIEIGQINTGNTVFTASVSAKTLKPGESSNLLYRFKPVNGTSYTSACRVYSNAENSPATIRLSGKGIASPRFSFDPQSVAITLPAGQKTTSLTSLLNKGQATGNFTLKEIRNDTKSKGFMKIPNIQPMETDPFAAKHVPNRLIIRYKDGQSGLANPGALGAQIRTVRNLAKAQKAGTGVKALNGLNLCLVETIQNANLREIAKALSEDPAVEYVEPDYVRGVSVLPNDPEWKNQYALQKIKAPQAWEKTKGSHSVIVAVIDTGIDYNHKDLQGNIWKNPGEIPGNRKDDDGNGYVDDVYGWDFANNDNNPMDGNRHGTHVAGTIAAASDNGLQVAGVAWKTKLVALKFLTDSGWGSVSDAIDAVAYCTAMDFPISNNSWGGGGSSRAMKDAIDLAGKNGHLFCAAAGNSGTNNDSRPHYPSSYTSPNVLSVAASDSADRLASFTCYGKTSVDLAAPGVSILNLVPNNRVARLSGTSMATPHVAGAAALVLSLNPNARFAELKQALMDSVDPIESYKDKMVAPGRLNLLKALEGYSPNWLSVSPEKGSVAAGNSSRLTFSIDATKLNAGTKRAIVCFETNDPLAKVLEIPVELKVTGEPQIATDKKSLEFGELWVGKQKELTLSIANPGTDVLKVSSLILGNKEMSVSPSTLSVEPGGKEVVTVLATPKTKATISTSLTITSNAKNAAQLRIPVSLKAILSPALRFAPENLLVTLEPDQSGKETLAVSNNGDADGTWKGSLVEISRNQSRTRNMDEVVKALNLRKPDFVNPGTPMIEDLSGNSENSPTAAVRTSVNDAKSDLEIAILGADYSNYLADVAKGLAETKRFAGVTSINVRSVTPTSKELEAFDSIIVYSNYPYSNPEKIGDNLASYADSKGGVVCMTFETSSWLKGCILEGKWLKGKYGVFETTSKDTRNWNSLGKVLKPGNPLLKNFDSLEGYYRLNKTGVIQGANLVANWKDGLPLVAYRQDIANVVGLNFFPASKRAFSNGWKTETDGWKLMANALEWSAQGGSPDWLKVEPLSGVVKGKGKENLSVAFNSANLSEGNYSAELRVSSNDPVKPYQVVKIKLVVRKNAPPTARPSTFTLLEDSTKAFRLQAHDPEGAPVSFSLVSQPKNGKLSGTAPSLTYRPNANFNGTDEFSFKVSDGTRESNVAKVQLRVSAVNDAPWAKSANLSSLEDEALPLGLQFGDPDGDKLTLNFTSKPQNGFVVEDKGSWVYFPNQHFNGKDSIRFRVNDGKTSSNEATLVLEIKPTNDAPIASDMKVTAQEGKRVSFDLVAADVDGDAMTYELISAPKHGRIETGATKRWAFTPNAGYNGKDFLTFRASDGKVRGNLAQVNFEVTQRNDPPVVSPATFALIEDGQLKIKLIASDPEGDRLSFKITASAQNGTLTGNGPTYSYKPDANFNGTDTFTVLASDGQSNSQPAVITLTVSSQNDAPKLTTGITTLSASYRETTFRMKLEAQDPDGDELTFTMNQNPVNGTCSIKGDQLVYKPAPGFTGTEKLEVRVSDGELSDVATMTLPIQEHPNSIGLFINLGDTESKSDFLDSLYNINERLIQAGEYLIRLDQEKTGQAFAGNFSELPVETESMSMDQWKDQLRSFDPRTVFSFQPQMKDGDISWLVGSFLDPASSTDTDLDDKNKNVDEKKEQKDPGESPDSPDPSSAPTEVPVLAVTDLPRVSAIDNAPNWYSLSGLGNFFDAGNDWIYQPEMGWCLAKVNQSDLSIWVFNEKFGWMWFPTELPNVTYMVGEFANGWTYFPKSSVTEAGLLYDYANESWIKLK